MNQQFFLKSIVSATLVFGLIYFSGCQNSTGQNKTDDTPRSNPGVFTSLVAGETGIDFSNDITEDFNYNIFSYEYLYNGAGVGAGDLNGDGLPDLYFVSAFGSNKLFLNLGNFHFKDVTSIAGVAAQEGYKTGVSLADINGDGLLDIHCCRTSKNDDGQKTDLVFINRGNKSSEGLQIPVFQEQAKALGLDDNSNTNHVCYFDFDRDGDLDVFYLNHRIDFKEATRIRVQQNPDGTISRIRTPATPFESNRMFRNDGGHFTDITQQAGLISAAFGLSVTAQDINQDGWMDLYVANDYIEPDYLYINNKDGTFTDQCSNYLKHTSQNSMGSDIADINNDGLPDIVVLDMKADNHIRYKELANVMHYDRYNLLVQYGYGRQQGRNMLQLNNGNNTFSEIGQYAGISSTDWSWSPLLADFNNDGWKDLYITNGYRKDVTNLDYVNYFQDSIAKTGGLNSNRFPDIEEFIKYIPDKKISNYLFFNSGQLTFANVTEQCGMNHPSFSTGAAYVDLDLDGDLDIVVNNINDPAFIYRNELTGKNWIQIEARQETGNTNGMGTSIKVFAGQSIFTGMIMPNQGFLSSSQAIAHFGLNDAKQIDSIVLRWPDGKMEKKERIEVNQRLVWARNSGKSYKLSPPFPEHPLFKPLQKNLQWVHQEQPFNDFKREKLLPFMLSAEGPCLATGDVNGDGLEDIFAGNGSGYASDILLQDQLGNFNRTNELAFAKDKSFEDTGASLEDFDSDGDLDLIVISGGNEFPVNAPEYMTRYYRNDGKGQFTREVSFPDIRTSAGAIQAVDIDHDNDLDIIIGGRCVPGRFPEIPRSYLLLNEDGYFKDATATLFPALKNLGMITDIAVADLDGDEIDEIVLVGDWMPICIFSMKHQVMVNRTEAFGMSDKTGWWRTVSLEDIDNDGDIDILAGNIGLNHRMAASAAEPITLITLDYDKNGSLDPVLTYYANGKQYPYPGRDAMIEQLPMLKKKYLRYAPYARATITDIFTTDQLDQSTYLKVQTFATTLWMNDGKQFRLIDLPFQAQLSPTLDILIYDFTADGRKDLLLAGNFTYAETETGEMDNGCGTLLVQQADGSFEFLPNTKHGFWAQDEVRELRIITLGSDRKAILTGNNKENIELNLILN